jgi:MSHA biogenesis protein MshM
MYLKHFGLVERPFGLTPDTTFAVPTRAHKAALNTLLVATQGGEGFIKITGEVGTGKTLLCRRFLGQASHKTRTCYIPNPQLAPRALLLALGEELGVLLPASATEYQLQTGICKILLKYANEGRQVIVCIDEAQAIPVPSLETLRLLSNLETEKRKLIQVVLFGQPELDDKLALKVLRPLRQRIAFAYRMETMPRDEIGPYLMHRLRVAGYVGPQVFDDDAIAHIRVASGGTPRLVNILAHKALMLAFGEGRSVVEERHARAAAADTAANNQPTTTRWWRWFAS